MIVREESASAKVLLFDATNVGHQVFHSRFDDLPIADRFGFALNRWRRACLPTYAIAVFDGPGDGWRSDVWPTYKATRSDDPSTRPSATHWQSIKAECRASGLMCVEVKHIEADDLIGSYTEAAVRSGYDVDIITSDKDLWQLIRETPTHVRVISPGNGKVHDSESVVDRWGVKPEQLADLLAIMGDTSDNYSGIDGVGPKTAAKLLTEYGSLDQLLDRAALVPGKMSAKIIAQSDKARLCRRLAGLVLDIPLPIALEHAIWSR